MAVALAQKSYNVVNSDTQYGYITTGNALVFFPITNLLRVCNGCSTELIKEATEKGVRNIARYYHHENVQINEKDDDLQERTTRVGARRRSNEFQREDSEDDFGYLGDDDFPELIGMSQDCH